MEISDSQVSTSHPQPNDTNIRDIQQRQTTTCKQTSQLKSNIHHRLAQLVLYMLYVT